MTKKPKKRNLQDLADLIEDYQGLKEFNEILGNSDWSVTLTICDDNDCHSIRVNDNRAKEFIELVSSDITDCLADFGIEV